MEKIMTVAALLNNLSDPEVTVGCASPKLFLHHFIADFGEDLLRAVERELPPVYQGQGQHPVERDWTLNRLKRKPFDAQREAVHAATTLLVDRDEQACVLNCDMGTGKTMMAICISALLHHEGYRRMLVLSPPHLVYKWRREILDTVPGAVVWVLNGPDTLAKLLRLRESLNVHVSGPEFFILGRVRMRMGFHWRVAYGVKHRYSRESEDGHNEASRKILSRETYACCPDCGSPIVLDETGRKARAGGMKELDRRLACTDCGGRLWTLHRPRA